MLKNAATPCSRRLGLSLTAALALLVAGCSDSAVATETARATPADLWAVWTDVAGWPRWDTEMSAASFDGNFIAGAQGEVTSNDAGDTTFTILSVDAPRAYSFEIALPGGGLRIDRTSTSDDETVTFTHVLSFVGASAGALDRVYGPNLDDELPGILLKLKTLVEERPVSGR